MEKLLPKDTENIPTHNEILDSNDANLYDQENFGNVQLPFDQYDYNLTPQNDLKTQENKSLNVLSKKS